MDTAERSIASRAAYAAYRGAAGVAQVLPKAVAHRLGRGVSQALWLGLAGRRTLVSRHMRRIMGDGADDEVRRASRKVFESYARYWVDAFRLPRETPESISAAMRVEGLDHLEQAVAHGRGVVLALPHLGGWDFGGAWVAVQGYKPLAVAEVLEPPELFEWFVSWRRRLGMEIVPADADAGTKVLEAVKAGRIVGLVSDRDIQGTGVEVEFFGEVTRLPAGPATLALRAGAMLLPAAIYHEGAQRHMGLIRPPLEVTREGRFREDVQRLTQTLAHELEGLIRRAPEQWHLMQPNWPSDPGWRVRPPRTAAP